MSWIIGTRRMRFFLLTIPTHAKPQTFLKAAILAPVPVDSVDDAVFVPRTLVVDDRALRPPEEALAALARYHAVMDATALIPTYFARDYLDLCCNKQGRLSALQLRQ